MYWRHKDFLDFNQGSEKPSATENALAVPLAY